MACAMIGITVLQWHAENHPGDRGNYAIVAFPYLFYVFFNISWGVGSWTYATEIFPVMYRAKGNALSTMTLWLACYIVAQVSPPIASAIGWGLYIIYSGICVIAFIFVRFAMGKWSPVILICPFMLTVVKWRQEDVRLKRCRHCLGSKAPWRNEVEWRVAPRPALSATLRLPKAMTNPNRIRACPYPTMHILACFVIMPKGQGV